MSNRIGVWIVVGAVLAAPAIGFAQETGNAKYTLSATKNYTASPWTSETGYANRAKAKLIFGAKNLLLGWTDLYTETHEAMKAGDNAFVGLGIGLKDTIENELGGAVHLVTFPLTAVDAPLPEGGVQF